MPSMLSSLNRCAPWMLAATILPALGCAHPAAGPTALSLRIPGDPTRLKGTVHIEAVVTPVAAFQTVRFRVGGTVVGVAQKAPFAVDLDTTAFPDGPVAVEADGTLSQSGAAPHASSPVELANFAPTITVMAPSAGGTVVGSPSKGFSVKPVVNAIDGNGVAKIWAEVGGDSIDLGVGDGSVTVPLPKVGIEFPAPPVSITIHAVDKTGAEGMTKVDVVPTNAMLRFEQATGGVLDPLTHIEVVKDGRAVVQIGASVFALPSASSPVQTTLTVTEADSFVLSGDQVFVAGHEAATGKDFIAHAALDGKPERIFEVTDAAVDALVFGPFVHSSGRVFAGWTNIDSFDSHLLAFEANGTKAFDTLYPAITLLPEVAEAPDGRLLTIASPQKSKLSYIQPFDPSAGKPLAPWALGAGQFVLVDPSGVVALYYVTTNYGAPLIHLTDFGVATGALKWDHLVDDASPDLVRRLPNGDVLAFLAATKPGVASSLVQLSKAGVTALWTGGLDKHDSLVGVLPGPGSNDLVVRRLNTTTSSVSVFLLHADGTLGWTTPLSPDPNGAVHLLSDGSLVVTSLPSGTPALPATDVTVLGIDGKPRWTATLDGTRVLGTSEIGGLLVLQCSRGAMKPFVYEARDPATGKLAWRYQEGPAPDVLSAMAMKPSAPWGVLLVPLPRALADAKGNIAYSTVVAGLLP